MDKVKKDTDYSLLEQERKWKSQITEISQQHREELQNVCLNHSRLCIHCTVVIFLY